MGARPGSEPGRIFTQAMVSAMTSENVWGQILPAAVWLVSNLACDTARPC
jgi:hypothetical protein